MLEFSKYRFKMHCHTSECPLGMHIYPMFIRLCRSPWTIVNSRQALRMYVHVGTDSYLGGKKYPYLSSHVWPTNRIARRCVFKMPCYPVLQRDHKYDIDGFSFPDHFSYRVFVARSGTAKKWNVYS